MKRLTLIALFAFVAVQMFANNITVGDFEYSTSGTSATVSKYIGSSAEVEIPSTVTYNDTTYTVTSIGESAFYKCESITAIKIPESVTSIGRNAFGYSGLTSIDIPESVTSIGYDAFDACIGLTTVNLPKGITTIESATFVCCESLTTIDIPENVTSIGHSAFAGCTALTTVNIPEGVSSIGWAAFSDCTSLTAVNLPSSVTAIDISTFSGCTALTTVNIPESVTSIDIDAFGECSNLTTIYCDIKKIFDIKETTFSEETYKKATLYVLYGMADEYKSTENWKKFNNIVETDDNVVGDFIWKFSGTEATVFKYLGSATEVEVPSSVTYKGTTYTVTNIGQFAFDGDSTITSISIPTTITKIERHAFDGTSVTSITLPDGLTSIGTYAFSGCHNLKSITLPESLTNLENFAFNECTSLTSVVIPEGITTFDFMIFPKCSSDLMVYLPKTTKEIKHSDATNESTPKHILCLMTTPPSSIFCSINHVVAYTLYIPYGKTSVYSEKVKVEDGYITNVTLVEIDDNYFTYSFTDSTKTATVTGYYGYEKNVEVPKRVWPYKYIIYTVTDIGSVFRAKDIESVTIPKGVTTINANAFSECTNLTTVNINGPVTSIGDNAFSGCTNLASINLPESVTSIGYGAFFKCANLTSITLPESLTSIGADAFFNCKNLSSVNVPDNVTYIGNFAFSGCQSLTSINIPKNLTTIEYGTFMQSALTTVNIPEGVTSICEDAFCRCENLTTVNIPESVTSIDNRAFWQYTNLTAIYCDIEDPFAINGTTFSDDTYKDATLYVPYGTAEKYKSTTGWKNFYNIVEMNPSAVKRIEDTSVVNVEAVYDLNGKRLNGMRKGVNIVKMSNGATRKVVVK